MLIDTPSFAEVGVQCLAAGPKDTFNITKEANYDIRHSEAVIDLAGFSAGRTFDVTGSCAGAEGFHPLAVNKGASFLAWLPTIADGDRLATVLIETLGAAQTIAFTIDVDDATGTRHIPVLFDKVVGATESLIIKGKQISAQMDANADVRLDTDTCTS